jgi:hypothetical protein
MLLNCVWEYSPIGAQLDRTQAILKNPSPSMSARTILSQRGVWIDALSQISHESVPRQSGERNEGMETSSYKKSGAQCLSKNGVDQKRDFLWAMALG